MQTVCPTCIHLFFMEHIITSFQFPVLVGNATLSPDLELYLFTLCFCDVLKLMQTICPTCIHLFFVEHSNTSFQFPVLVRNATISPDLELYLFTLHFCDALKLMQTVCPTCIHLFFMEHIITSFSQSWLGMLPFLQICNCTFLPYDAQVALKLSKMSLRLSVNLFKLLLHSYCWSLIRA